MGIEQTSDDANNVWGLLRRKGMDQEYSLVYHTSESGERDTYRLGRAAGNDIIDSIDDFPSKFNEIKKKYTLYIKTSQLKKKVNLRQYFAAK